MSRHLTMLCANLRRFVSVEEKRTKTEGAITAAKDRVTREIEDLRDKLKLAKETIVRFRQEIEKAQAVH